MLSATQIVSMSDEAAEKAARKGRHPYKPWNAAEVAGYGITRKVPFPFIGSYRPVGWELVEHRLVDSSGFGANDEPALTLEQLREWVTAHRNDGWAIIEAGEFQVVIGRFVKVAAR